MRELRDALARRRVPCVAVSPLIGGRAVKGPADRMLQRLAGGTSPRHVAGCYPGLIDALVVDDADADDLDGLGEVRPIVTRTLMSDADARRAPRPSLARAPAPGGRSRGGARVRVAIVGGTGDFGLALARRLVEAGDEVVIGSRDAERAQEKANEVGATGGAANEEAVTGADIVVLATKADAALPTATALVDAIGATPVLSVASDLRSTNALSLAQRMQDLLRGPVVAGLHSLAAGKLAHGRPTRTPSSAATTGTRRRSRSSLRRRSSQAARSTPGRWRALARSRG